MKNTLSLALIVLISLFLNTGCSATKKDNGDKAQRAVPTKSELQSLEKAYFASGCFWCVEAIFESVKGVKEVISGYAGGDKATATYPQVSSGSTRHAEAVEVYYDPEMISYTTLLEVFFGSHDPTTLNRQGPDRGPQYRSAIFYRTEEEHKIIMDFIANLEAEKVFESAIVTEVVPFTAFYSAEAYHQDYEVNNPGNPYVQRVSIPRLKKFQKKYPDLLKENNH